MAHTSRVWSLVWYVARYPRGAYSGAIKRSTRLIFLDGAMDLHKLLSALTPQIYANLCRAVELGRWPDGKLLTVEQRALCLQAVIAYDAEHKPESARVGYLPPKVGKAAGAANALSGDGDGKAVKETSSVDGPLQWRH